MSSYSQTRKIGPTRRSISGFFSFRGEESIPYESSLERDFLMLQAADVSVTRIIAQPAQINFRYLNGPEYTYTPDFLVFHDNPDELLEWQVKKPQLIEVKPRTELQKNFVKWRPKFKQAVRFARDNGFTFHFADESRIRTQTLKHLQFLERFKRFPHTHYEGASLDRLITRLEVLGHSTVGELIDCLYQGPTRRGEALAQIWHLLAVGRVTCDLTEDLNIHTEIWVNTNAAEV
jgi:hypothetical protein